MKTTPNIHSIGFGTPSNQYIHQALIKFLQKFTGEGNTNDNICA